MQITAWSEDLSITADGRGVVSHVGSALPRIVADRTGLTGALSAALVRPGFTPVHDRGRVLTDLAVVIADGGTTLSEIAVLRDQGELFGPVASMPTVWRTLHAIDETALTAISQARAVTRERVWDLITARHGSIPAAKTGYGDLGDQVVIRLDASIVIAHSEKAKAAATFKSTFGFHPLTAWCDNTGESLAMMMRPGNAGSNTSTDHVDIIAESIRQIPPSHRGKLLITIDGAGSSHAVIDHLTDLNTADGRQVHYSVGVDLDARVRKAIGRVGEQLWQPALDPGGQPRADAGVVELTGLLRHSAGGDQYATWPADMRIIARREPIHPGSQPSLFEQHNGHRFQILATNTPTGQLQHFTSPPPSPRPRRGPHPGRESDRTTPLPVPGLRDQHRVADRRRDR